MFIKPRLSASWYMAITDVNKQTACASHYNCLLVAKWQCHKLGLQLQAAAASWLLASAQQTSNALPTIKTKMCSLPTTSIAVTSLTQAMTAKPSWALKGWHQGKVLAAYVDDRTQQSRQAKQQHVHR